MHNLFVQDTVSYTVHSILLTQRDEQESRGDTDLSPVKLQVIGNFTSQWFLTN